MIAVVIAKLLELKDASFHHGKIRRGQFLHRFLMSVAEMGKLRPVLAREYAWPKASAEDALLRENIRRE